MNIFYLDKNPEKAAQYYHDKHVVKMIIETAQILCNALRHYGFDENWMYKMTHKNHPCVLWAIDWNNFNWLCKLGFALSKEYTYRYDKKHKSNNIIKLCYNIMILQSLKLTNSHTDPPLAIPEKYRENDSIKSYRNYYLFEKKFWVKKDKETKKIIRKYPNTWTKRGKPFWWIDDEIREEIKNMHTRELLDRYRGEYRSLQYDIYYGYFEEDPQWNINEQERMQYLYELKLELSNREHVPNKKDGKIIRRKNAKKHSKGRSSHKKIKINF